MQKLNRLIVSSLVVLFSISGAYSLDKEQVYKNIKEKAENAETVFVRFKVNPEDDIYAEIYSKKGGLYKLFLSRNTIISDGTTIWNVHHGRNVIISNYESGGELAIEEMLLTLLSDLVPVNISKDSNSDFGSTHRMKLHPDDDSKYHSEIDYIDLFLDKNQKIKGLIIKDIEGIHYQYIIDEMNFDIQIPESEFKYSPPSDIEVMDFR